MHCIYGPIPVSPKLYLYCYLFIIKRYYKQLKRMFCKISFLKIINKNRIMHNIYKAGMRIHIYINKNIEYPHPHPQAITAFFFYIHISEILSLSLSHRHTHIWLVSILYCLFFYLTKCIHLIGYHCNTEQFGIETIIEVW